MMIIPIKPAHFSRTLLPASTVPFQGNQQVSSISIHDEHAAAHHSLLGNKPELQGTRLPGAQTEGGVPLCKASLLFHATPTSVNTKVPIT